MPQVAAAVEALDADAVARAIEGGGEVGISIDGHDHTLKADEVSLVMEPLQGYQVEAEAGHAVGLSLELDDELQTEGWAREIVHAVQAARKQAGLEVTDRIALELGRRRGAARRRPPARDLRLRGDAGAIGLLLR